MQSLVEIVQTYCKNCHLATPTWRNKCIHCGKPVVAPEKIKTAKR